MSDPHPPSEIGGGAAGLAEPRISVPRIVGAPPGPAELKWRRQPMVRWFSPGELAATAMRAVLSSVFGSYADRREVQAALHQHDGDGAPEGTAAGRIFRFDQRPETEDAFWVDFVADLGDGFRSTYTVAWLLGQPTLPVPAAGEDAAVPRSDARADEARTVAEGRRTRRGHVLVMGGDQVYPTASREEYTNRLAGPYEAALPWVTDEPPRLFAIPGNHDWYDGLTSFIRQFCQQRWIGGWKTEQSRSYWALKLPRGWWLLGVDVQLQSDIDQPQLDYFCRVAEEMRPGDRVILCTAEPAWVHTEREEHAFDNLAYFESRVLAPRGAELALTLTGDLHHYARYSDGVGTGEELRHKITSGGGGAYLLGTQLLPGEIHLAEPASTHEPAPAGETPGPRRKRWVRGPLYPTCPESLMLKLGAVKLFWKNWSFTFFLGFVYALFAWFLQTASETSAAFSGSFMERAAETPFTWAGLGSMIAAFTDVAIHAPSVLALNLLLVAGMIAFCAPDVERSRLLLKHRRLRTAMRVAVGAVHGTLHVVLIVALTWLLSWLVLDVLGTEGDAGRKVLVFALAMLPVGGVAGTVLMSLALLPFVNYNEAFSAQHLETYKHFLRLRLGRDGRLTVYAYGVDRPASWRFHPRADPGEPYFDAAADPRVRLIDHLTLAAPRAAAPRQENGS